MALTQSQELVKFKFEEFKKLHFPTLSDGLAFMQYATTLCLQQFQLSEPDIQAGVTEGRNDGGIDGFHIIVNRTEAVSPATSGLTRLKIAPTGVAKNVPFDIVVVQSKSTMDGALDGKALQELHGSLNRILSNESLNALRAYPLNEKVIGQVDAYRRYRTKLVSLDPIRSFTVYLMQPITDKKLTQPDKRRAGDLKKMIESHLGSSTKVAVELLAADGIEKLRNAPRDVEGILKFASNPLDEKHGKSSALLGLVTIGDLLSFVRRGKTAVLREEFFTTNVREFAGSATPVNAAIRKTLSTNTDTAFWWMNNGVTIIVDRVAYQSDGSWLLVNPQIVNGLQTTNVVHEAANDSVITAKRRKESLLVRVISEVDPKLRESIIQGTNNQTQVNSVQLYANDERQLELETFLETKGWFYERRRWQYRNRKVSRSRIRSILELAQVVIAAALLEPDTARARPRDRLKTDVGYKRVFSYDLDMSVYSTLLDMQFEVERYLGTATALAIANDPTNDRFFVLAGAALRLSGVRAKSDYTQVVMKTRLKLPSDALLAEVHSRLYKLVGSKPDKKERDKLFKGAALRDQLVNDILTWNAKP
ncbi:MAG: AIPR family protein [Homoserinimonas sp.]